VLRLPDEAGALVRVDVRAVVYDRRGRVARVPVLVRERERSPVHDRLERGARLAERLGGAVELAAREVVAADEREDVAARDVNREERALDQGLLEQREAQRARATAFGRRGFARPGGLAGLGRIRLALDGQYFEARHVADREDRLDLLLRQRRLRPRGVGERDLAAPLRPHRHPPP